MSDSSLVSILEEIAMIDSKGRIDTGVRKTGTADDDQIELAAGFFHRILQAHSRFVESRIQAQGITLRQYTLLSAVSGLGNPTQRELTDGIGMDRSTLSDVIKRLSANGLILQKPSKEDRRANVISLTNQGRKVLSDVIPIIAETNKEFFGVLGEDQLETLVQIQRMLLRLEGSKHRCIMPKIEDAPSTAVAGPGTAVRPDAKPATTDRNSSASLDRLHRARTALDAGLITQTEFELEKHRFLSGSPIDSSMNSQS